MIATWVRRNKDFPNKLAIEKENPLIKDSEIESDTVQKLLYGLIEEKIVDIHTKAGLN